MIADRGSVFSFAEELNMDNEKIPLFLEFVK